VPIDTKQAIKDDVLPDGTRVQAGDYVFYSPFSFGRAHCLWGADADEFKPTRWEKESPSDFKFLNSSPALCHAVRRRVVDDEFRRQRSQPEEA
jgi:cytochrome P450